MSKKTKYLSIERTNNGELHKDLIFIENLTKEEVQDYITNENLVCIIPYAWIKKAQKK